MSTTSRRAMLIGAAALAAAPPASLAASNPDAELVALGHELSRRIEHAEPFKREVGRLRVSLDRMHRRILERFPDRHYWAWEHARRTPVGKEWQIANDLLEQASDGTWELAERLVKMRPATAAGAGALALAGVYLSGPGGTDPDLAQVVKACMAISPIRLPGSVASWLDELASTDMEAAA